MLKKKILDAIKFLYDPSSAIKQIKKKSFDEILSGYMVMLLLCGGMAFLANIILSMARSLYFDLFSNVKINYLNAMNYGFGIGFALFFLYLFAGTFILFIVSLILNVIFRKIKYIDLLKLLMYSMTPLVLFAWIPILAPSLVIWSIFLFVNGIKSYCADI